MTPKKDDYMRGYSDGFKDARKQMQPPAGETIRSTQDGSMEAEPGTGQSPVGSASPALEAEIRRIVEDAMDSAIPEPWEVSAHAARRIIALSSGIAMIRPSTETAEQGAVRRAKACPHSRRERQMSLTENQIKHMVSRFLQWRLPANFNPDAGISFTPEYNIEWNAKQGKPPQRHEPVGTNLFDAIQAEAMVKHMLDGLPSGSDSAPLIAALQRCHDVLHHCMGVLHPHDAEKASAAMAEAREAIAGASLAGDRITDLRIALNDIIALDHHWHGPESRSAQIARAALLRDDDMAAR